MKTSEIYRQAKAILWDGVSPYDPQNGIPYICDAIDRVSEQHGHSHDASEYAKKPIRDRLQYCFGLQQWLHKNGHITDKEFAAIEYSTRLHAIETPELFAKLQATRLAWLDSLISEFKAKGD